jgi:hypothetical protein
MRPKIILEINSGKQVNILVKLNVKVDLHAMKAYTGNISIAALILNLGTSWGWGVIRNFHFPPILHMAKEPPVFFFWNRKLGGPQCLS